jgi:cobalt-precorrin 5A hydrolase / precorrin-3B C17-methyltransferase
MVKPVLFVLGASALPLARKLKEPLGAEIHTPDCVAGGDVTYPKATAHLGQLFAEAEPSSASARRAFSSAPWHPI